MNEENPLSFDLTPLKDWERVRNSTRDALRRWAGIALGAWVIIAGVYTGFFRSPRSFTLDGAGVALDLTGALVISASWWYGKVIYQRAPDLLQVSSESISFGRKAAPKSIVRLAWEDPHLRIVLYDRSAARIRLGAKDRYWEYQFVPAGGPPVPIPKDAFGSIITAAARHHLDLRKRAFGSVNILTIQGR